MSDGLWVQTSQEIAAGLPEPTLVRGRESALQYLVDEARLDIAGFSSPTEEWARRQRAANLLAAASYLEVTDAR
jgi:hypothetical protein